MQKLSAGEVRYWQQEAKSCEDRQERELKKRNNYPLLIAYYEGMSQLEAIYPHVSSEQQLMILNEYFCNTNALISEIMFQNPDISADATKPMSSNPMTGQMVNIEENARLMRSALMYGFDKSEALIENRLALFDMLYAGYCGVEVGHIIEQPESSFMPPMMEESRQSFMGGLINKAKEFLNQEEVEEDVERDLPKDEERRAMSEKTFVRRWNPLQLPLDWRAETFRDLRYSLKKVYMSRAEFNTRYPNLKDKLPVTSDSIDYSKHDNALYKNRVTLYEFQIRKTANRYCSIIISPNYGLSEVDYFERAYTTNGFNIKYGALHKYGRLYPISTAQVNKKLQDELEDYVDFIKKVAEHNIPKYLADKNKVKIDAETAIKSTTVNDIGYVDGNPVNAIVPLPSTNVSAENKELLTIFMNQKEKQWSVSASKLQGKSEADFATELNIQEAGFQASRLDIQEGLRVLIKDELETFKDIIVTFWDGEYFFKITGGDLPEWYIPQKSVNPATGNEVILNPLTDILTADYEIKVDISSSLRPNKERRKKEIIEYLTWLIQSVRPLLLANGKDINIEEIKNSARDFGFSPENLIIDVQMPMAGALPVEGMPATQGEPVI